MTHHVQTSRLATLVPLLFGVIVAVAVICGVVAGVHVVLDFINQVTVLSQPTP